LLRLKLWLKLISFFDFLDQCILCATIRRSLGCFRLFGYHSGFRELVAVRVSYFGQGLAWVMIVLEEGFDRQQMLLGDAQSPQGGVLVIRLLRVEV